MPVRHLDPTSLGRDEDWEGNNAAFRCPACGKVYLVSAAAHRGVRSCPECGRSTANISLKGGRKSGGTASIATDTPLSLQGFDPDLDKLYQTLLATRNFEIGLFWQRSNYFLLLNSGLALGFFNFINQKDANRAFALVFAVLGAFASLLWFWVCLGGKFWQTRWEQRLKDFESANLPGIEFFSAEPSQVREDVRRGLNFHKLHPIQRLAYRLVLLKPSVSFSMIQLAALFTLGWLFALIFFARGK